ncbi:MAG: histone deacetylase family protein [Pseudomonadota bacterium]
MTLFYFDDALERHDTGPGHPESPARLATVREAVRKALPTLDERRPTPASDAALALAHTEAHVERVISLTPAEGLVLVDGDTVMSPESLRAARLASGALVDATDAVLGGVASGAFCAVRPPGHHAERERAMGFCFFNSIAVAACRALDTHGVDRVAILDFDVHHANGTEDIFRNDPRVLLCSSFQHPHYPYTNSPSVEGELVNVPLKAGTGSQAFRDALAATWWPALAAFDPDLILVSAGFDAHTDDPLGDLRLTDDDYGWLGKIIAEKADRLCEGRVIAALEGGYDLAALGRSAARFCEGLARG